MLEIPPSDPIRPPDSQLDPHYCRTAANLRSYRRAQLGAIVVVWLTIGALLALCIAFSL